MLMAFAKKNETELAAIGKHKTRKQIKKYKYKNRMNQRREMSHQSKI